MSVTADYIKGWIPYRLREEPDFTGCRWLWTDKIKFDHPFFDETLSSLRRLKENIQTRHCESSLDILPEWAAGMDAVAPTAIIFHVSRCGSTLLSQYLTLDPARIVLSEVPFFDDLLRWGFRNEKTTEAGRYLEAAIRVYGNRRWPDQQALFIKTDSWHLHFYAQLRALFPSTPFILLYRRPDEIIRSQQKQRGMQSVPGLVEPALFGFVKEEMHLADLDRHMTAVLETYFTRMAAIATTDPFSLLCNYTEGMQTIFEKTLRFCGQESTESERQEIVRRSHFHAKQPQQVFEEPPLNEKPADYLKTAINLYDKLEKIRIRLQPTS